MKNKKAKVFFVRLFIVILFVFLIAGIHYGFYFLLTRSDILSLKHVVVSGCNFLNPQDVVKDAGLSEGQSILEIDLVKISRILERNPFVEKAEVKRILPDRIEINVTEKKPVANFAVENNYYLLDKEGRIILRGFFEKVPVMEVDFNVVIKNEVIQDDFLRFLLKNLYDCRDLMRIKKVLIKKGKGVFIYLKDIDVEFYIGNQIADSDLLDRLFAIAEQIKSKNVNVKYVDLRRENAIAF